jgi:hypothetical protein
MKNRTLDELRQVKEYGWTPADYGKEAAKIDDAIRDEINSKQDQVAQKLDMILDLEDIIRTEMFKLGLHPEEYPNHEFEVNEAFRELFDYALRDLRYHYFNTN